MNRFATRQQSSLGNASCDSAASAPAALSQASYASSCTPECQAELEEIARLKLEEIARLNPQGGKQTQSNESFAEGSGAGASCISPPEVAHQQPGSANFVEATPSPIHDLFAHACTPPGMLIPFAVSVPVSVYPMPVPVYPTHACFGFNETPGIIDLEQQMTPAKRLKQRAGKWLGRDHQVAGQPSPVKKKHGKAQASAGASKQLPYATEEEWQTRIDKRQEAVDNMKSNPIYYEHRDHIPENKRPKTPDPSDRRSSKRDWEADVSTWRADWRDLAGVHDLMQMGFSEERSSNALKAAARRIKKNQKPATSSTQCFMDLKEEAIAILLHGQ